MTSDVKDNTPQEGIKNTASGTPTPKPQSAASASDKKADAKPQSAASASDKKADDKPQSAASASDKKADAKPQSAASASDKKIVAPPPAPEKKVVPRKANGEKRTEMPDKVIVGTDAQKVSSKASIEAQKKSNASHKEEPKTLRERVKANKKTRWLRFGIVSLIFFGWVYWMGNPWLLLAYPLLFDIYITGYIPFTWWKKSKNPVVKNVMSWVDAIVYALVLVYFIFAFVGQNYMIPTSSLEKTLLTGDYLWVNKATYGPRVPITPIHFPLVHNKLPIINTKSYLDWPQNSYHRLKGLRDVETFDIVVFNFPAGDTVALKSEEVGNPLVGGRYYEQLVEQYGWEKVNSDKAMFGDIVYRPVDRRENYVKRAVGLPGQRFKIVNDTIYINGEPQPYPENIQFNYIIALNAPLTDDYAHSIGISHNDYQLLTDTEARQHFVDFLGVDINKFVYFLPMTQKMLDELSQKGLIAAYAKYNDMPVVNYTQGEMYPKGLGDKWTASNWGGENGVLIPKKGTKVRLNKAAWELYQRCIRNYENNPTAEWRDGKVYIEGEPVDVYTFKMDYYFMMGDNRDNSLDSRFWGFVPEDHIVGTPEFVIASFDQDRSLFNGGLRTDRIFIDANPDK